VPAAGFGLALEQPDQLDSLVAWAAEDGHRWDRVASAY
jgi:hypothetical protein